MNNINKLESETIKLIINNRKLYEMANIHPEVTGIKAMLYSTFDGAHKYKHGPRVKVETKNYGLVPVLLPNVTISKRYMSKDIKNEDKKLLQDAIRYIKDNVNVFLAHWNGQIRDDQLQLILTGKDTLENILKEK